MPEQNVPEKQDQCQVFISYAREDIDVAKRLYRDLEEAGVKPWMDKKDIRIGENWQFKIRQAVKESDYFLALISEKSVSKKGYVQKELKLAMDILDEVPPDDIFVLPIRLDESIPRHERLIERQWGDLFPSYDDGLKEILQTLPVQGKSDQTKTDDTKAEVTQKEKPTNESEDATQIPEKPLVKEEPDVHGGGDDQGTATSNKPKVEKTPPAPADQPKKAVKPKEKIPSNPEPTIKSEPITSKPVSASKVKKSHYKPVVESEKKQSSTSKKAWVLGLFLFILCIVPFIWKKPIKTSISEKTLTATKQSKPRIQLSRDPLSVSSSEAQKVFKLDSDWRPLEYVKNEYENQGKVIVDYATGLMWGKAGSDSAMYFYEAQPYIDELNQERFAEYSDWRLPSIDELMSLLEPEKQSNDLYIDPMFDSKRWCWSADTLKDSSDRAWYVLFDLGRVNWSSYFLDSYYVRAVRSIHSNESKNQKSITNTLGMKFVLLDKGFYMQTTEVTQGQWKAVKGNNPSEFKDCDDCPVEMVSWRDVQKFIKKLNQQTGGKYRLPTEAEWEYACRAGSTTTYYFGDGENMLGNYAWYDLNSGGKTHPVGQKKPNAWGLYDMHGSVSEWCQDNWSGYGSGRVYRGGSWEDNAGDCQSAYRGHASPDAWGDGLGFRLSREAEL